MHTNPCLIPCVIILSWLFGEMGLASAQAVADCVSMLIALPLLLRLLHEFKAYTQEEEAREQAEKLPAPQAAEEN